MKTAIFFGAALLSLQVAVIHSQSLTADDLTCIQENTGQNLLQICTDEVINSALGQDVSYHCL